MTAARIDPALCLHPRLVRQPMPEKVPTIVRAWRKVVMLAPKTYRQYWRCLECGLVGEKA